MAKKEITYTEAMNEIEQILDRFRREEMTVDSLTKEVKRATELIALCKERLHRTEVDVAVGQELAPPGAADGTFDAPADIKPS